MPLSKPDRLAFSAAIVAADQQIKGLNSASNQLQKLSDKVQALDTANSDLLNPSNNLINYYQTEFNAIDGTIRTSITEQNIIDSANHIIGNFFFPNDINQSIPSLSALNNVWSQIRPFALAFGVGKKYNQTNDIGPSESSFISTAQSLISSTSPYSDIQLTSGQHCLAPHCSLPIYTNQVDCEANSGIWTPTETIVDFPEIHTINTNLISAVNSIITQVTAEAVALSVINDSNPTRQAQNVIALNYINNTLLPALNLWLSYPDFNTAHGQTTCAGFNGYNANLLAPTKLHSAQITVLISVLSARSTFLTTRVSQLNTNLGSLSQDINTGIFTGTGLYKQRMDFLNLRINAMTGSLTELIGLQQTINAQGSIATNLTDQKSIYMSIVPTTRFAASANGTPVISLKDASFYSPGDLVYIISDTQPELTRAIKSINGNSVILNDQIPTKYTTLDGVRFYKDNS